MELCWRWFTLAQDLRRTNCLKKLQKHLSTKNTKSTKGKTIPCLRPPVGWDAIPAFLPYASLDTCPATGCWDYIPAYRAFFFVLFVFFVDQAVAFDVFGGCI